MVLNYFSITLDISNSMNKVEKSNSHMNKVAIYILTFGTKLSGVVRRELFGCGFESVVGWADSIGVFFL